MKQLIIAIDFSDCSINALRVASNMASALDARLQMVHVCRSCEDDTLNPSERTRQQKKELEEKLDRLLEQYSGQMKGRLDYKIKEGRIYKAVVDQAKEVNADMIIAGTHGVSGVEEFFMGSNAFRMVTASDIPTLTINQHFGGDGFRRILMPIDASKDSRQKIPLTASLAKAMGAEIYILGIYAYSDKKIRHSVNIYCKQASEYLQQAGLPHSLDFIENRKIAGSVMDHAGKINADLISIMSDIESDDITRLLSSDVQRIINHSTIPVLCSPARELFNYEITYTGMTG